MLRTNSKKAKQNIRQYIIANFDSTNYSPAFDYIENAAETEKFSLIKEAIRETFKDEYLKHNITYQAGKVSKQTMFIEWASGLPSILDTCYYYNRSAVDDLATILEETEIEKSRFTESHAEEMLTKLIYREIFA